MTSRDMEILINNLRILGYEEDEIEQELNDIEPDSYIIVTPIYD